MNNKKAILAFPRSGTKLLAGIFQNHGYHNFGEFFNTYSTNILYNEQNIPYAQRLAPDHQKQIILTLSERGTNLDDWTHSLAIRLRMKQFLDHKDLEPSIFTFFPFSLSVVPELIEVLDGREIFCLRRKNKFDQLLSRCITVVNSNHNNEIPSKPIKIELSTFGFYFYGLLSLEKFQDHVVNTGQGRYIDFDDLISNRVDLGFNYSVRSEDQHTNLESLVTNINEIKERFNTLKKLYDIDE